MKSVPVEKVALGKEKKKKITQNVPGQMNLRKKSCLLIPPKADNLELPREYPDGRGVQRRGS